MQHPEQLQGLNEIQLEALAEGRLAVAEQAELDQLLQRNSLGELSDTDAGKLDHILDRVDQLNILKARAILTLQALRTETADV